MQTHWAQTVRNPEVQRQINVHQGHSWETARTFYTYTDQVVSGQVVSRLVDRDLEVVNFFRINYGARSRKNMAILFHRLRRRWQLNTQPIKANWAAPMLQK